MDKSKNIQNQQMPYFVFFTEQIIDPKDKSEGIEKYLSYGTELITKQSNNFGEVNLYIKGNLIFINSADNLFNYSDKKIEKEKIKDVINQCFFKKDAVLDIYYKTSKLYVFIHGSDLRGESTPFSYQSQTSGYISDNTDKDVKVYFFTHSPDDPINKLLLDYKTVLYENRLIDKKNIKIDEQTLSSAIEKYINRFTFISSEDIDRVIEDKDKYYLLNLTINEKYWLWKTNFNTIINYFLDKNNEKKQIKPVITTIPFKKEDIPEKRVNFFDSSIWFRMVEYDNDEQKENKLNEIINEIEKNYENSIYDSAVAHEFRDLELKKALIEPLEGGAHSGKVAPFQFHSETEMKQEADKLYKELKNYKWNFLLIDDFANKELRNYANQENFGKKEKQKILTEIIGTDIIANFETALYIEKDQNKKDNEDKSAITKIEKKTYDVILLDYLFSNEDIIKKGKTEYGIKLFDLIKKRKITNNRGIKNKYWIFPVSVFNSALLSDMQKKGYEYYSENWYFSPGADPINTPHLFKYKLYQFLKLQLSYFPSDPKELIKVFLQYKDELKSKDDLKNYCYKTMPYFLEKYGFIFELNQNEKEKLTAFSNSLKKKFEGQNKLSFSITELAETIRNFLNYGYNPTFQKTLLLNSFIKLSGYKEQIIKNCNLEERDKTTLTNLNDLFKQFKKYIVDFY